MLKTNGVPQGHVLGPMQFQHRMTFRILDNFIMFWEFNLQLVLVGEATATSESCFYTLNLGASDNWVDI